MDKSENLKDAELYQQVCTALKKIGNAQLPSQEEFYQHLKKIKQLIEGHKSLLTAIGKL
ncbi:MAG: hypothetical protein HY841_11040 [Bacteroidetes bacterium]|nr:hypothetical protein [Bacteroidota bacterium]